MPGLDQQSKDYMAMMQEVEKLRKRDEWSIYVTQNKYNLNRAYKRWYGKNLTSKQLMFLASGGLDERLGKNTKKNLRTARTLYYRINEAARLEQYAPVFHSYFGRNPTLKEARRASKQFTTPEEYGGWLKAGEEAKALMPEITELWGMQGAVAPTLLGVQKSLAGRKGEATFAKRYEEFKERKKAMFTKEKTAFATGQEKQTGLVAAPGLAADYEY